MRKIILILLLLMFFTMNTASVNSIVINEIMYNPSTAQGSDTDLEWVELFNENTTEIDVSNWYLYDNNGNTTFSSSTIIHAKNYLIIARDPTSFLAYYNTTGSINCTVLDGNFQLGNTEDTIILYDNISIHIDNVTYLDNCGANGNNKTLERNLADSWEESRTDGGTPGEKNSILTLPTCDVTLTIDEYTINITPCDVNVEVRYWTRELYNSVILKNETTSNWQTINSRSDWGIYSSDYGKFRLSANITTITGCNDTDWTNNYAEREAINLEEDDVNLKLDLNSTSLDMGDDLRIYLELINGYNTSVTGNLTVKIGREKSGGSYEYPEDWYLIDNQQITLSKNSSDFLRDILGYNLTWTIPEVISGIYKVYATFDFLNTSRSKGEEFTIIGLANIFITSWEITSSTNLALGDAMTLNTTINITNNETTFYDVNLTLIIEDVKTVSEGEHNENVDCGIHPIAGNITVMKICDWSLPNDTITSGTEEFKVHPQISFEFNGEMITKTDSEKEINITGLEDLGEPTLEIISSPGIVKFGDFTTVLIRYETNNYNFPLRFIAYPQDPKYISMDLDGKTIYQKFCEKNTVVEVNVSRNETLYLSLPIFLKRNCDNAYSDGVYESYARVCKWTGAEWEYMSPTSSYKKPFNLSVSGRNNEFCPTTTTVMTSGSGGALTQKKTEKTETTTTESPYKIISCPSIVYIGEEFTSKVKLTNNEEEPKSLKVYSYVFEGNKLLSEGFDEEKWGRSWTANEKEVTLNPDSSVTVTLKNRIKEDVSPGSYKFRVRIKEGNKNKDIDEMVEIRLSSLETTRTQNITEENTIKGGRPIVYTTTSITTTIPEEEQITGRFAEAIDSILRVINSLISWLKGLFHG